MVAASAICQVSPNPVDLVLAPVSAEAEPVAVMKRVRALA